VLSVQEDDVLQYAREEAEKAFERKSVEGYLETGDGFWKGWKY
jgi:hypothetical protein